MHLQLGISQADRARGPPGLWPALRRFAREAAHLAELLEGGGLWYYMLSDAFLLAQQILAQSVHLLDTEGPHIALQRSCPTAAESKKRY